MAFYGYLSHQSKSLVFFPKIWTPTQKIGIHPKKTCFWYRSIHPWNLSVRVAGLHAHAHLFGTEAWVKCLGQWLLSLVTMAGICRVILGAQGMFGSLFAAKKRIPDDIWLRALCMWYEFYLFKPLELKPQQFSFMSLIIWAFPKLKPQSREPKLHQVPRCHGAKQWCFYVFSERNGKVHNSQHPLKPEESQNGSTIFLEQNFRKLTSKHDPREADARRPLNFSPPKKRKWMERKSGKCTSSRSYSFTLRRSGFQKPSSASLSSLLYHPDHWTKVPAGLHAVAVLVGCVGYGQCTSTSCTRQGKHGKHHNGTTSGSLAELQRECTQGSLLPLGQSAKDFNKLQLYLPGNWMVNGAKLVFHPNIKLRHVVFSDQGGSWHCLKYIRAASVAQLPGV